MIKICPNCNNEFKTDRSKQIFCSPKCHIQHRSKTMVGENHPSYVDNGVFVCKYCGKENKAHGRNKIFCDVECYKKWLNEKLFDRHGIIPLDKIICNCGNCGKELKLVPWEFNRGKYHFCGRKCHTEGSIKLGMHKGENNKNPHMGFITVKCECCEKDIIKPISLWNANKNKRFFCSKECRGYLEKFKMEMDIHPLLNSKRNIGADNARWKDNATLRARDIRRSSENLKWKKEVVERDNHTCIICGSDKSVVAHHLKPFMYIVNKYNLKNREDAKNNPELYNINNGVTLCKDCHNNFHKTYGIAYFTPDDFKEYLYNLKLAT